MTGHQINEGVVFTRLFMTDDSSFPGQVQFWLPNANASTVSYITGTLSLPIRLRRDAPLQRPTSSSHLVRERNCLHMLH